MTPEEVLGKFVSGRMIVESFSYHTQQVDMEKWARKHKSTDENLLNFNTYAPAALRTIFYNQSVF